MRAARRAAAVLLSILILPAPSLRAQDVDVALMAMDASVTIRSGGQEIQPGVGTPIPPGAEIVTGPGSSAVVGFSNGSKVRLGAGTTFKLEEKSPGQTTISIIKGRIDCWIRGLSGGRFRVRTPSAVASVRGTVFSAETDGVIASFNLFSGQLGVTDLFGRAFVITTNTRIEALPAGIIRPPIPLPAALAGNPPVEPPLPPFSALPPGPPVDADGNPLPPGKLPPGKLPPPLPGKPGGPPPPDQMPSDMPPPGMPMDMFGGMPPPPPPSQEKIFFDLVFPPDPDFSPSGP